MRRSSPFVGVAGLLIPLVNACAPLPSMATIPPPSPPGVIGPPSSEGTGSSLLERVVGGEVVSAQSLLDLSPQGKGFPLTAARAFTPGRRLLFTTSSTRGCAEHARLEPFDPASSTPLDQLLKPGEAWELEIAESLVKTGASPELALLVNGPRRFWIHMSDWGQSSCVVPASKALTEARDRVGSEVRFTPSKPGCERIRTTSAVGMDALLTDDGATPRRIASWTVGAAGTPQGSPVPAVTQAASFSVKQEGWLGVGFAQRNIIPLPGAMVAMVTPNSPASKAGIQPSALIMTVNGKAITNSEDLIALVRSKSPGDVIELTVLQLGKMQKMSITLGTLPGAGLEARDMLDRAGSPSGSSPKPAVASTGPGLWFQIEGTPIQVDDSTVAHCFSRTDESMPDDTLALKSLRQLRVDPSQCATLPGKSDLKQCSATVGVWESSPSAAGVEYRRVRRTVASTYLLDGRVVDGKQVAGTPVSFEPPRADDSRLENPARNMDRAVRSALDKSGLEIRLEPAGSKQAAANVRIEMTSLRLGSLERSSESKTSRYKVRDEIEDNPAYPGAVTAVENAEEALEKAEKEVEIAKRLVEAAADEAERKCKAEANKSSDSTLRAFSGAIGGVCGTGTRILGETAVEMIALRSARNTLSEARKTLSSTPKQIVTPIMADWSYSQENISREASVTVRVIVSESSGSPIEKSKTVSRKLAEYEVAADSAHNVPGHKAKGDWLRDENAMIPLLLDEASQFVANEVRAVTQTIDMNAAMKSMRESGVATKEGFERVHAMAMRMARGRLKAPSSTGRHKGPGELRLPLDSLDRARCQLVVAVADDEHAELSLVSNQREVADLRNRFYAAVEVCGHHLSSPNAGRALLLSSKLPTDMRYAVYPLENQVATATEVTAPPDAIAPTEGTRHLRNSPVESLSVHLRPTFHGWLMGTLGAGDAGEIFSAAPGLAIGVGARPWRGTQFYLEWERTRYGVGNKSPYASLESASAWGDRFSFGVRKYVRPDSTVSFLIDWAVGYSALHLEGEDRVGSKADFALRGLQTSLAIGPSIRVHRYVAIEPFAALLAALQMQYSDSTNIAGAKDFNRGSPDASALWLGWYAGVSATADWDWRL